MRFKAAGTHGAEAQRPPPAAWLLTYDDGGVGLAHTQPDHRQRGLMTLLMVHLTSRLLLNQSEVIAFAVHENVASQRLMEGMGWERMGEAYWTGYKSAAPKSGAAAGSP